MDCLFCKIINREITANIVFENKRVLAFEDIHAQAPCHILVIPKKHIASMNEASPTDQTLLGEICLTAAHLAKEKKMDEAGYRLVVNTNDDGGQTVHHIHMHILGGRAMGWPPG